MQQILSLGEVARLIGRAPYKITYAIAAGLVPDASARFAGKRAFSEADVRRIASYFGAKSCLDRPETPEDPTT